MILPPSHTFCHMDESIAKATSYTGDRAETTSMAEGEAGEEEEYAIYIAIHDYTRIQLYKCDKRCIDRQSHASSVRRKQRWCIATSIRCSRYHMEVPLQTIDNQWLISIKEVALITRMSIYKMFAIQRYSDTGTHSNSTDNLEASTDSHHWVNLTVATRISVNSYSCKVDLTHWKELKLSECHISTHTT